MKIYLFEMTTRGKAVTIITRIVIMVTYGFTGGTLVQFSNRGLACPRYSAWTQATYYILWVAFSLHLHL